MFSCCCCMVLGSHSDSDVKLLGFLCCTWYVHEKVSNNLAMIVYKTKHKQDFQIIKRNR